jgi:hypothetical protein
MLDIAEEIETETFNKHFWEWFDHQTKSEKDKFNYFKADMAKIYFYNKFWKTKKIT